MSDENERSVASAGSVEKPVAWAVWGGEYGYLSLLRESAEEAVRCDGGTLVPLYCRPQPTLTDAEREAVEAAIDRFRDWVNGTDDEEREVALRILLERLK